MWLTAPLKSIPSSQIIEDIWNEIWGKNFFVSFSFFFDRSVKLSAWAQQIISDVSFPKDSKVFIDENWETNKKLKKWKHDTNFILHNFKSRKVREIFTSHLTCAHVHIHHNKKENWRNFLIVLFRLVFSCFVVGKTQEASTTKQEIFFHRTTLKSTRCSVIEFSTKCYQMQWWVLSIPSSFSSHHICFFCLKNFHYNVHQRIFTFVPTWHDMKHLLSIKWSTM